MRYLGGKSRLARYIAPFLRGSGLFYEPFVGGFNIVPAVQPHTAAQCSDTHKGLIKMFVAIQQGWRPPASITERRYYELKQETESPLRTFASFGASFGGKEWGGFARDKAGGGGRDLAAQAARSLSRKIPWILQSRFTCSSFEGILPAPESVIYCDPPYAGTTPYTGEAFDVAAFVYWCNTQARRGCEVLVSEFTIPCPTWQIVWSYARHTNLEKHTPCKTELLLRVVPE